MPAAARNAGSLKASGRTVGPREGGRPAAGRRVARENKQAARGSRMPSKLRAAHDIGFSSALAAFAALLFVSLVLAAVLATGDRAPRLARALREAAETRLASLGYRVGVVHLQGAAPIAQPDILAAARVPLGAPILTVDLAQIHERLRGVGWVASARVIRLLPDTIVIAVVQRPLLAIWEHGGRTEVIADNGAVLARLRPAAFSRLPLVVGPGANLAAAAILPLVAARPNLARRVQAFVRVDGRRWDLRLVDGAQILLPAQNVRRALGNLDTLDRESHVFGLGLARIDLRDPEMVIVRPAGAPPPAKATGV